MKKKRMYLLCIIILCIPLTAQKNLQIIDCKVDFSDKLQMWDGFGVNYVEACQTLDYYEYQQDYGGFSILKEEDKNKISHLVFGDDGLKINILKMFLDPFHQAGPKDGYNHTMSTTNMMYFANQGRKITQSRGDSLQILTTLYGPPAYMNTIRQLKGRDLDPKHRDDLAEYMIDWVKFLKNENFPVKYLSLHNEGEDWGRMPVDGGSQNSSHAHLDYNMYWPPEQVVDYINITSDKLKKNNLADVRIAPGELTNWYRFSSMGYARAIAENSEALKNIGLITSHGFYNGDFGRLFSGTSNEGSRRLQELRPDLKAWTTSMSWMNSSIDFANLIYYHIYLARVNAIIPWAFIQRPQKWEKGDPNPGNAVTVFEDSTFRVTRGYYLYKQFTQAGQPGTSVVYTESMDPSLYLLGFASDQSSNPDAFIVINNGYTFSGIADALELYLKIDGKEQRYFLSYKEPIGSARKNNPENMMDVNYATRATQEGYVLEASIPWKTLGKSPDEIEDFLMDVQLQSGAEDKENVVGWQDSKEFGSKFGRIRFSQSKMQEDAGASYTEEALSIDGEIDAQWKNTSSIKVEFPRLEGARINLSGQVKLMYNQQRLCILAEVSDPTNLKHKRLAIALEGSKYTKFDVYRTSYANENFEFIGQCDVEDGKIIYDSPAYSVSTLFGIE